MLHRTMVLRPNFHSLRFNMTTALNSKSFKSAPALEVNATLRDLVAAMPIVLFVNAVRSAFSGSATTAATTSR
jgi:hypothetical protein